MWKEGKTGDILVKGKTKGNFGRKLKGMSGEELQGKCNGMIFSCMWQLIIHDPLKANYSRAQRPH